MEYIGTHIWGKPKITIINKTNSGMEFMTEKVTIYELLDLQIQKKMGKLLTEKQLACLRLSDFVEKGETLVIRG